KKVRDSSRKLWLDHTTPISKMNPDQLKVILSDTDENIHYKYESHYSESRWEYRGAFEGVVPNLERIYRETESESKRDDLMQFMRERPCERCKGRRLRDEALAVRIEARSILEVCDLSVNECYGSVLLL